MAKKTYNDDLLLDMDKILTPEQEDDVGFWGGLWDSLKGLFTKEEESKIEESRFIDWYKKIATELGLSLDPDDPRHYYDYRGYWKKYGESKAGMVIDPEDNKWHFPDEFKLEGHPTYPEKEPKIDAGDIAEPEPDAWQQLYNGIEKEQEPLVWKAKRDPLVKRIWNYLNPLDLFKYDKPHYEPTDEMKQMTNTQLFAGLKDTVISDTNKFMKYEQELRNRKISPLQYMETGAAIATFSIMGAYGIAGLNTLIQSSPTIKAGLGKFISVLDKIGLLRGTEYVYQAKRAGLGLMYAGYPLDKSIIAPIAGIETVGELQLALNNIIPQYPAVIEKLIDSSMKGMITSHEILSATQEIPEKEVKQTFSAVNALKKLFGIKAEEISKEEKIALEQMRPKKEEPLTEEDLDIIISGKKPEIASKGGMSLSGSEIIKRYPSLPPEFSDAVQQATLKEGRAYQRGGYVQASSDVTLLHEIGHLREDLLAPTKSHEANWERIHKAELEKGPYGDRPGKHGGDPNWMWEDLLEIFGIYHTKTSGLELSKRQLDVLSSNPMSVKYLQTLSEVPPTEPPTVPPRVPPSDVPITPDEPEQDPIDKLNDIVKAAKPERIELTEEQSRESAARFAEARQFIQGEIDKYGGEQAYHIILSKFKGPLAEGKLSLGSVRDKLTQEDVNFLFKKIIEYPYFNEGNILSAGAGLKKLFKGEIPEPKQLVLLGNALGTDIVHNILAKRLTGQKITDLLVEIANIPRALLATGEFSGTLRQGAVLSFAHPILAAKAVGAEAKFALSPEITRKYFEEDLPKHKYYKYFWKRIDITDPLAPLGDREEPFYSRILQRVPGIGHIVGAAERAYSGYLTKLRVDVFSLWVDDYIAQGIDLESKRGQKLLDDTGKIINIFTGRAKLPGKFEKIAPILNTIFFSPKRNWSIVQTFNPWRHFKMEPEVRKKAVADFAKFVGVGLTTLSMMYLYKLAYNIPDDELSIEPDPRSADFGKIKIGNTRFDVWAGYQQWARTFAQIMFDESKSSITGEIRTSKEFPFTTRWDRALRFAEGKMAPTSALVKELMQGSKTYIGEDMTLGTTAYQKFIPMYIQDIVEAYMDGGLKMALPAGAAGFLGIGVQTYGKKKPTQPTVDWQKIIEDAFNE